FVARRCRAGEFRTAQSDRRDVWLRLLLAGARRENDTGSGHRKSEEYCQRENQYFQRRPASRPYRHAAAELRRRRAFRRRRDGNGAGRIALIAFGNWRGTVLFERPAIATRLERDPLILKHIRRF